MATVEKYRNSVRKLMQDYITPQMSRGDVETQFMADAENDHYQLIHVGWENEERIHRCLMHIDIKEEKIWIQHNSTESYVAEELVDLGISPENIVLGFHSPYSRQFTGFAVN